jgi:hypothetical protein
MEPNNLTVDLCEHERVDVDRPAGLAAGVRQRHQRLLPHLEFLTRLAARMDDHDEHALRNLLLAGLDCTDDDVLAYLEESKTRLYPAVDPRSGPATQLIAVQHHGVGRLRHQLRDLAVGDLDQQSRREAVRQRLYELNAVVRSLLAQETEVCLPLLDAPDPT